MLTIFVNLGGTKRLSTLWFVRRPSDHPQIHKLLYFFQEAGEDLRLRCGRRPHPTDRTPKTPVTL